MYKYGIDWNKENKNDGGFLDDRYVRSVLEIGNGKIPMWPEKEKAYREKNQIPESVDIKEVYYRANAFGDRIRYDKKTETYYFIAKIIGRRMDAKSIVHIKINSELFENEFDEIIEVPRKIQATLSAVRVIIPINRKLNDEKYNVHIEYKDTKAYIYDIDDSLYSPKEDMHLIINGKDFNRDAEYDIEYDKNNVVIEYGYEDAVDGLEFVPIEDAKPYKNENGVWTSKTVEEPEIYIKSKLDWYYSDERMVEYIEEKGLLPQDKIDAIRAANYEDIFSFEYKMKSATKIIPIVLVIIVIAILVIKKIRKKIF